MGKFVPMGGGSNPLGYCHYHKFTLTKHQMERKQCLKKNCPRFEKYNHPYWTNLEKQKQTSKINRQKRKIQLKKEKELMDRKELIQAIAYCKKCPTTKKESLEYCSQCRFSNDCMAKIMDMIYDYLTNYEQQTFNEWLEKGGQADGTETDNWGNE